MKYMFQPDGIIPGSGFAGNNGSGIMVREYILSGGSLSVTEKIYYDDQYCREFTATVRELRPLVDDRWGVVLDRTAFYPEGGGQPGDTGWLDGIPVLDVYADKGAIVHVTAARPGGETVSGRLDWGRRFDHMQQHSGEHILSAAFDVLFAAKNVGFHLSADAVYIDVTLDTLSAEQAAAAEDAANAAIFANRPVRSEVVAAEDLDRFPLRKRPAKDYDAIRLVCMERVDCCPCGGTHVSATGEIGLIKIRSWERRAGTVRVDFVCGGRALADYRLNGAVARDLSSRFSVPVKDVPEAAERQSGKLEALAKELQSARQELTRRLADDMFDRADRLPDARLVMSFVPEATAGELSDLARRVLGCGRAVVLLATGCEEQNKAHFLFACTPGIATDMSKLLKKALALTGGKGGGNAHWAQGGGAWCDKIEDALQVARADVSE